MAGMIGDSIDLRGPALRIPTLCLRWGVLGYCIGVAGTTLRFGDELAETLNMDIGWSWEDSLAVASVGCWVLLTAAVLQMISRRAWPVLVFISGWSALLTVAAYLQHGGEPFREVLLISHSSRWLVPLALCLFLACPKSGAVPLARITKGIWLLRIAAAVIFAMHGYEALGHKSSFIDYILMAGQRVGMSISQEVACSALTWVGVIDMLLALLVLTTRWRFILAYMAFWGLVTAGARIVHSGLVRWDEFFLRAPNFCVPLALFFYWRFFARRSQ